MPVLKRATSLNCSDKGSYNIDMISYDMYHLISHMSYVTCHTPRVICHMSYIMYDYFFEQKIIKVLKLVGGGSVTNGATLSSLKAKNE